VYVVSSPFASTTRRGRPSAVCSKYVVVSPPGEAHGFVNTGPGTLQLTAIHGASRFDTEWLSGPDPAWTSKPR